jgi:RTX calcium-binding nonapeptide repeat (4 copies)
VVGQGRVIAMVRALLIGCAVLLVIGASGVRAEASQEEQEHTGATKQQTHSGRGSSDEDQCERTRTIIRDGAGYLTNDVPGCPKGGLLSDTGTDCGCALDGGVGNDEIHGRSTGDEIFGGSGSDTLYGGPGGDFIYGTGTDTMSDFGRETDRDVFYGGDGPDTMYAGKGADVIYGGDGNDDIVAAPAGVDFGPNKQQDKLYCGAGRDYYFVGPLDYVDSSCEEGRLVERGQLGRFVEGGRLIYTGGPPLIVLAGAVLLGIGLLLVRYVTRRAL